MPAAPDGPKRSTRNRTVIRTVPSFNDPAFAHTFADTSDALLILDASGIIANVNRAAGRMFGRSMTSLRRTSFFSLITEDQRRSFRKEWRTFRAGAREHKGLSMSGAKGRRMVTDVVWIPGRDGRHCILRLRDMTASYAAVEALREAEHRYSAFIHNSSEGIWCFGVKEPIDITVSEKRQIDQMYEHGYLRECNDAYAAMYGFGSAAEIVGIRLKDVMPRSEPRNIAFLTEFIRSGYRLREKESTEQDRNGRTFTVVNNMVGTVVDGKLMDAWGTQRDVTEQWKAEKELRETKEAYVSLVDRLPFVVYTWRMCANGERRLEYVSPQSRELLGLAPEILLADNSLFVTLVHPDDRRIFIERGQDPGDRIRPFDQECRAIVSGVERWLRFESTPAKEANGDIVWNGIVRDITDRKRAQQELHSMKDAYADLIQRIPVIVYKWRRTTAGTYALDYISPRLKDFFGIEPSEVMNDISRVFALIHPEDREPFLARNEEHARSLTPFSMECRFVHQGVIRWIQLESTPTHLPNGDVLWDGIMQETTERVRSQRMLGMSEERYRNLVNNLTEGIWVIDKEARTTLVNPRMAAMIGRSIPEIVGRPLFDFIPKSDVERTSRSIERRSLGEREHSEYTFLRPDGTAVQTTVETYPLQNDAGEYIGAVAAFTDVTEQRKAEERLRRQNEQHRFLAEASSRLAECRTDAEVYSLISTLLTGLIPEAVVFVLKTSLDGTMSTLMEIGGIDDSIVMMGAKLLRYEPRGRQFRNKPGFVSQFCRPTLHHFDGGLHEASDGVVPKFIARRIERLLRVEHYYSVGISTPDRYFGYIHIMTPLPLAVDATTIEAFMHQCYMALTKISSAQKFEEEASRRRFFFENASDGIVVLDKERRVIEVNRRFLEMHGFTADEMLQMHSWDFSADFPTKRAMEKRFPGPPPVNQLIESRHRRKDGSVLDVEITFNLAVWNNEPQIHCVVRDITERKQAAMLIEQEAVRRKTLMNTSSDGIVIIDHEHRVVECNPSFCRMLGYDHREMLTLHTWDWEAISSEADIRAQFADLRDAHGTFESRHRRKDGSIYDVEISLGGAAIGDQAMVIAVCRDITERKRMVKALHKSEERYRTLVDRIPQRVFLKDIDSLYVSCNAAYAADLGLTPEQIAGKDDYQFFPSHIAETYRTNDRLVVESRTPMEWEEEYLLNGVGHIIHTTKVPMIDAAGTVTGVLGIFSDITERKRMERTIAENEERMRAYLEHSPAILTIVDPSGVIRYINRTEGGYSVGDFIGASIFDTIDPSQHAAVRSALGESLREHATRSYFTSANVNGETWWYENRVVPLGTGSSELLITSINVTEQKRAEQERRTIEERIRMSEASYRGLFNSVQDAIYILNAEGVFLDVNAGAEAMYGYAHDELVGRTPADVSAPGRNDDLDLPFLLRRAIDGEPQQFEFWGQRQNGEEFPKDVHLYPGTYYGERVVIALAQDITIRKQLEYDREQQVRELQMLYELTQLSTRDTTLQEIYEYAVTFLVRGMHCQKSSILLFDPHGVMQFRAASGLSEEYKAAAAGHSPWNADADDPQPIFVDDVELEPTLDHLRPQILREGIRALGFIPLLHDGRLLGKFMVYYDAPRRFTEREAQLAQTIAQTIANAIVRKRDALALAANEQKLRTIFSAMEEGLALNEMVYNDQGEAVDYRILEVNAAFEHIASLSRDQVIGRLATDIYHLPSEYIRQFWKEHRHDTEAIKTDLYTDISKSWKHVSTSIPVNGIFVTSFIDITDLKNKELALQTSEQYNRTLLDSSPNAMAVTDLNGRVVYVNNRALEMYGYEHGDSLADASVLQWVPETHQAEAAFRIVGLKNGVDIDHFVLPLLHKDGSTFIGEVNATAVRGPDGVPTNFLVITADITARITAEEEVRTRNAQLLSLINSQTNFVIRIDTNGRYTFANDQFCRVFEVERDRLIGSDARTTYLPEDHAAVELATRQCFEQPGRAVPITLRKFHPTRGILITDWEFLAITDETGVPTEVQCVGHDITEKYQALEELRLSEERYRTVANFTYDWELWFGPDGRVLYTSPSCERVTGYRPEEITADPSIITAMVHPEDRPSYDAHTQHHAGSGQTEIEFRIVTRSGDVRWINHICRPITGDDGRSLGRRASNRDITERKQQEAELRASEQRHRAIVENLHQAYYESNRYALFTYVNPGLVLLSGYTEAELMERSAFRIVADEDRPAVVAAYKQWMIEQKRKMSIEFRVRTKDGTGFWVEQTSHFEFDEHGTFLRAINFVRDIEERKRSELQLFESELRYRKITEAVTDYIYTVTMQDGTAVSTTHGPGCFAVTGYSVEEFQQNRFLWNTMIVPEDRAMVEEHIRRSLEQQGSTPVEHRIIRKDGTLRWVRNTLVPRYNDQGVLVSYEGLIQDITERRTTEEELRHSEERNRALIRTIPDLMFVHDSDGRILDIHEPEHFHAIVPAKYFIGKTMEEIVSMLGAFPAPWFELMAPELPVPVSSPDAVMEFVVGVIRQKMRSALESGDLQSYEYSLRTEQGVSYYEARLIGFDHNRILHIIRDITEARVAEENLRRSEQRNRALIESLPDLLFVLNADGRFMDYHAPENTPLYVRPDNFIGRMVAEVLPPEIGEMVIPRIAAALRTNTIQSYEYSLVMGPGTRFYEASIVAIGDDLVMNIVRDVTARVSAERSLKALNEELEDRVKKRTQQLTEANQELEAFSYSVSHDLRAPLRAIDSFSAMLVEGYADKFDGEGRRLIGIVRTSIKKMDQLINGLLTLSRIGRNELHRTEIEMNGVVASVLREHLPEDQRARYTVEIGTLPPCIADETLLRQALGNLISNAVKYSSAAERPEITITGSAGEEQVTYSVRDNGVGFDPANSNKLFGIFQRLHTDEQFKGLGIGLSIVQRIVHRHGGRVHAEGRLNGGAVFSFTLPLRPADLPDGK